MGFLKRIFSKDRKSKGGKAQSQDGHSSSRSRTKGHIPSPLDLTGDSDKALSRLLRSASSHFKIVSEIDYNLLPPLPHPVNTVSSRSTSSLTNSNNASAHPRSSFSVTVHERQHHSSTEFPNAYPPLHEPPLTPLRKNDQRTTPEPFKSTKVADAPATQRHPRDAPFTPRDVNRVRRLRQDPSVLSLVNLYDADGRLGENVFVNTPARPATSQGEPLKRQSTFKELLGNHGASEADLLWAEQLIAENSPSTPTHSTASLPLPRTPSAGSAKHCVIENAEGTFSSETSGTHPRISSMIVEVSITTDDSSVPKKGNTDLKGDADANAKTPNGVNRVPMHRASQVFKFISERRRRCRSLGSEEMLNTGSVDNEPPKETPPDPPKGEESNSKKSTSAETRHELPTQPPSSFKPLSPALRGRSNSTGTADILRASASSEMLFEVDPTLVSYKEFKESHSSQEIRRNRSDPHTSSGIPCTSTPVDSSKISRSSSHGSSNDTRPHGRVFGDLTNANLHSTHLKAQDEQVSHAARKKDAQPNAPRHAARKKAHHRHAHDCYEHDPDHDPNYKYGTKIERRPSELASRAITPRRTAVIVPYASNSLPLTPTHRRSLLDTPSPVSSSELSPEAQQIMAALRARRAARMQREIGKGSKRNKHAIRH